MIKYKFFKAGIDFSFLQTAAIGNVLTNRGVQYTHNIFRGIDAWGPLKFKNSGSGIHKIYCAGSPGGATAGSLGPSKCHREIIATNGERAAIHSIFCFVHTPCIILL
jgi:hypothetical protein